ncbi:MAG: hypothetical protein AB8B72_12885 [Crocinitomicaceae bacterium]
MAKVKALRFLLILAIASLLVGSLFMIMHWPYSRGILFVGYCGLFLVYPRYALFKARKKVFTLIKVSGVLLFTGFKTLSFLYPDYQEIFKLFSSFGILLFLVIWLYQYMGFENFQSTMGERLVALAFLVGSSILAVGLLFKIIHWPPATIIIVIGLVIAAVSFFLTLFTGEEE